MSKTILFENASLLDLKNETIKKGFFVLIENDLIQEIRDTPISVSSAEKFNLADKTLMPGLIDAHVHVSIPTVNFLNLEQYPQSYVSISAVNYLKKMLGNGFTTVRDACGADWGIAKAIEDGLFASPRLYYSGKGISKTGGHGDTRHRNAPFEPCHCHLNHETIVIADGERDVRVAAREELRKGATQIKLMASGGVLSPIDPLLSLQYSPQEIRAAVEEANDMGRYVMAHAHGAEAIKRCIENGVRCIEHGTLIDEATAHLMSKSKTYLVPTLVVLKEIALQIKKGGLPSDILKKLEQLTDHSINAIHYAKQAGVKVGFGTDSMAATEQESADELLIRHQAGESAASILASATIINAEILQAENKLGVIAPGAYADLIVVEGNPLEDLSLLANQGKHISLVMKAGIVYKNKI